VSAPRVIAIDGPSGSGKSTVARGVASALGLEVLDTGAMYRAVTFAALESKVALDDGPACARVARDRTITVEHGRTTLDGRDISAEIRGPDITMAVSIVAPAQCARCSSPSGRLGGAPQQRVVEGATSVRSCSPTRR
jgi:cytidylate kinase